jgi:hypothetical protein
MAERMSDTTAAELVLGIERALRSAVPEAIFASPRVVRRIIRADLDLPLVFARVPHRESIALPPSRLLELADDVWALPENLPGTVLLVARPDATRLPPAAPAASGLAGEGVAALLREYWRRLYHGCLDIAARRHLATHVAGGAEFAALVRELGETPFEEARTVLAQEGLLRDRDDAREALSEFIAVFLELTSFAPTLVPVWFPAVGDVDAVRGLLARLVDAETLLVRTRPEPLAAAGLHPPHVGPPHRAAAESPIASGRRPLGRLAAVRLRRRAAAAARRGNDVRAALELWRLAALAGDDAAIRDDARRALDHRSAALVGRLDRAVGTGALTPAAATALVGGLLDRAAGSAWSQQARFLYDLQKTCVDAARESYRTQLVSWALTLGRVPLIRPLPSQRVALVHRHLATALRRLPALHLPEPLAQAAAGLLGPGLAATEAAVRGRIGPEVRHAVTAAGLVPRTLVEEVALDKLVDEIVDGVTARGFESFGALRDAVSRNQVKLADLAGLTEFVRGDALLRADRMLTRALDGAYRPAPAYLVAMQRLSSVAFGVPLGRAVTLHLLLPFGGAWILLKGLEHLVEPLSHYSLGGPVHLYSHTAVLVTGAVAWVLMHLAAARAAVLDALVSVGRLLHFLAVVLPRRLLRLPLVDALLRSRPVRFLRRYVWSPLVLTGLVWLLLPHGGTAISRGNPWLPAAVFVASAAALNSALGRLVQERVLESVGRTLQQLHAHLVVGLVGWVIDLFRRAVDLVEGMLYAVDEQLRFRADESRLALAVKAVLTTLWSGVDWIVRFCVTLLIEPQLNPIKHFPVVTVSHKLLVPMIPMVSANLAAATGMQRRLAITTVTFISTTIPGVFGFLAWELKENWRLYAANRPRLLSPVQVGRHGETLRRLLVPGFHSGTIPKLFARLRRHTRDSQGGDRHPAHAAEEEIAELARGIASFVDDECLGLLRRTRAMGDVAIRVADVRLSTNRIAIDLAADALGPGPVRLEFVQGGGSVSSRVAVPGWLIALTGERERLVRRAFAGLDCLCDVDFVVEESRGVTASRPVERIAWAEWRDAWERGRAAPS